MFGKRDKKAVFYYSRIVEGIDRSFVSEILLEPVRVENQESLGKTPQFCCAVLEKAMGRPPGTFESITFVSTSRNVPFLSMYDCVRPDSERLRVNYCPFCGAGIEIKQNLRLKAFQMEVSRSYKINYFKAI